MKRNFNFTSFFSVLLKSTARAMKNDVYSFFISHLILKLSHFLYFELDVTSLTWDNGNNKKVWYLSEYLIKFNETRYT
jgi:hypothetical protein